MPSDLLKGHHLFQSRYVSREREFLEDLAEKGQRPKALYISCSDSRVVPELLVSAQPGDLFVVRNVANLVPPLEHADASVGAAVEYAVEVLKVPDIIVCGHYGCGGVKAVVEGREAVKGSPSLYEWLEPLEKPVDRARSAGLDKEATWRYAVEENVLDQLDHLVTFAAVGRRLDARDLQLHAWVYDLESAALSVYDTATDKFVRSTDLLAK